jgi:hypothetical protein
MNTRSFSEPKNPSFGVLKDFINQRYRKVTSN